MINNRLSAVRCAIAIALGALGGQLQAAIHVSPTGNDSAPGTADMPFATLEKARDAARALTPGPDRRVIVHGGKYYNISLLLASEDSGLVIEAAKGEKPILFGGQQITGWVKDGDSYYAAPLPAFPKVAGNSPNPAETWDIRMLQVNGQSRPRARFPEKGSLEHLTVFDVPWMSSTGGGWKRKPTHEELTTMKYKPGSLDASLEITNAEVTVFHMWDESCASIIAHDPASQTLTLAPELGHPPGAFGVKKYAVWNTREGMTMPGQWYFDRARNRIVYWPKPGEAMEKAEVIVPSVKSIIQVIGRKDNPVKNVTVRGLALSVNTVPMIIGGFAADRFNGTVKMDQTENCTLDGLTISGVAGHGIEASSRGTRNARIQNCEVAYCGAGGIYVGGTGTVISNNLVHGVGMAFPSAIGIFRGGTGNVVCHNEVHDCSYSAINYGGKDVLIENNLLYDCMKVLHDGAAIYVFGAKHTILRGNVARDITDTGGYGASAYYLDEQSSDCIVEQNLSVRVGWPSHNHMATNNLIRNNLFIVNGDAKLTFPRSTGYMMDHNIIYATGKIRIEGVNATTNWVENLFYSASGKIESVTVNGYSPTSVSTNAPAGTLLVDPLFRDLAKGDYRFKPQSPVLKWAVLPEAYKKAGRIGKR